MIFPIHLGAQLKKFATGWLALMMRQFLTFFLLLLRRENRDISKESEHQRMLPTPINADNPMTVDLPDPFASSRFALIDKKKKICFVFFFFKVNFFVKIIKI